MRSLLAGLMVLALSASAALAQKPALEEMWSLQAAVQITAPPVLADIDGLQEKLPTGEVYIKHPEIIFGSEDGKLMVVNQNHKLLAGWPVNPDTSAVTGIAVADLDSKYEGPQSPDLGEHPEIVATTRKGALVAYDWHGKKLWQAKSAIPFTRRPSIADVNGDGWPEVVSGSAEGIAAFDGRTGKMVRRVPLDDPEGSFELADLDGDGTAEIVVSWPARNQVRAVRADGTDLPGWPVKLQQPGSPIVADIDDDGAPEVIVPSQDGLTALKLDGSIAKGWPVASGSVLALAAGDVDRDGRIEIMAVGRAGATPARVMAFAGSGQSLPGFPVILPETEKTPGFQLTIAPVAGNKTPEIEVLASDKDASQLYLIAGNGGGVLSQEKYSPAAGIALAADQSRTLIALPQGTSMHLLRAAEGSAKPWAFDWPMANRTPEGNRALTFPVSLADLAAASPIAVDLDENGTKEILIGSADSSGRQGSQNERIYAIRGNGTLATGWPVQVPEDARSLAAGDIAGDSAPEVVLSGWDGTLRAWAADGTPLWPPITPAEKPRHLGGVTLADLDGDGKQEILFGTMKSATEGKIYAYSGAGKLLWQYPAPPTAFTMPISSTPAVADVNGKRQIILTTRGGVDDKGVFSPARLIALGPDGKRIWGDDKEHSIPGDVFASPALADINGDGRPEIVFGSAGYVDAAGKVQTDGKLYVYDMDGKPVAGWPKALADYGEPQGWIYGTPAIGDVDGDGKPEIAAGSAGTFDPSKGFVYNNGGSKLYLWKTDGSLQRGWPYDAKAPIYGSPLMADANGDGLLEVIAGAGWEQPNAPSPHGKLLAVDARGNDLPGWPKNVAERQIGTPTFESRPLFTDLEGAGRPSIFVGSCTQNNAYDPGGSKQGVGKLYRFWTKSALPLQ